jgi:hypothetical protein
MSPESVSNFEFSFQLCASALHLSYATRKLTGMQKVTMSMGRHAAFLNQRSSCTEPDSVLSFGLQRPPAEIHHHARGHEGGNQSHLFFINCLAGLSNLGSWAA